MDESHTTPTAVITTTIPKPISGSGNVTTTTTKPTITTPPKSSSNIGTSADGSITSNKTNNNPNSAHTTSPKPSPSNVSESPATDRAGSQMTTANPTSTYNNNKNNNTSAHAHNKTTISKSFRKNAINGSSSDVFASIASASSNPDSNAEKDDGSLSGAMSRTPLGGLLLSKPSSPVTSPTLQNGSFFLRHQFFRAHRALPSSPTTVFVPHTDVSVEAAEKLHRATITLAESLSQSRNVVTSDATEKKLSGDANLSTSTNAVLLSPTLIPSATGSANYGGLSAVSMKSYRGGGTQTASGATEPLVCYGGSENTENCAALLGRADEKVPEDGGGDGKHLLMVTPTDSTWMAHYAEQLQGFLRISEDSAVDEQVRKQSITVLPLLGLMFCNSIGGGYGLEESLHSGGALITILGVLVLPVVFSLPIALVVAELATSVPTNGGFLMWINVSMPPTMYFFSVIVTLLLTFVDNALYPVLFSDYVCQWTECSEYGKTGLRLLALFGSCFLNLLGIEAVGIATILITIISVCPFALMILWHLGKNEGYVNWENIKTVPANIEWVGLLSTLSWNVAGMEQAGSLAEDIQNPQRTIMLSMVPLIVLVWLSYIPPVFAGVSQSSAPEDWSRWETGYWADIADQIGGLGFKTFLVVGSIFSSLGLCLSCLCVTSRVMAGMGEAMAFPRMISSVLKKENKRFNTPHWSILINTALTGVCTCMLDFSSLVTVASSLYGIRILLIFMACIKLRYAYPSLDRPFEIPVSTDKLVLLLAFPIVYCVGLVVTGAFSSTENIIIFGAVLFGSLFISYFYCKYFRPLGFDGGILPVAKILAPSELVNSQEEAVSRETVDVDDIGSADSGLARSVEEKGANNNNNLDGLRSENSCAGDGGPLESLIDVETRRVMETET